MFVQVDPQALFSALESCGFARCISNHSEVSYERKHKNDNFKIIVFTSITEDSKKARGCGSDAIRVIAIQRNVKGKLYSKRVYRVTSQETVIERTIERAREAYKAINEILKGGK